MHTASVACFTLLGSAGADQPFDLRVRILSAGCRLDPVGTCRAEGSAWLLLKKNTFES